MLNQLFLIVIHLTKVCVKIESAPNSQKPLNPLKGTFKSSLIFNEFPFRGQG